MGKLEQQLEKSRESLTLEREKARTTQSELWRKEKELSDTKIDLRIANRETKTSEAEVAKLKEAAKRFDGQLKVPFLLCYFPAILFVLTVHFSCRPKTKK